MTEYSEEKFYLDLPKLEKASANWDEAFSNDLPIIMNEIKMNRQKLINFDLSKGFALGISCDKEEFQIAIIFFIVSIKFSVIKRNWRKFIECFKD